VAVKPNPFGQANDLGSAYPVTLPAFQGPLDLLLHLIERDELDISEISLVGVTDQYLRTLEMLEELEPGAIADFLMVASRLLFIKSRMLLPKPAGDDDDEEDSADDLLRQLLEYKRFREVADQLRSREEAGLRVYVRTAPRPALERRLDMSDVDLSGLNAALQRALARMPSDPPMPRVRAYSITVAEQIDNVRSYISSAVERKRSKSKAGDEPASVSFVELLSQKQSRVEVIVTFLAVLELIKQHELVAVQSDTFGEIELMPIDENDIGGDEAEYEVAEDVEESSVQVGSPD
jgi:segregation and condensation protein A